MPWIHLRHLTAPRYLHLRRVRESLHSTLAATAQHPAGRALARFSPHSGRRAQALSLHRGEPDEALRPQPLRTVTRKLWGTSRPLGD